MVVYAKQFETILHFKQHNNVVRVLGRCYFNGLNVYITSQYLDLNHGPLRTLYYIHMGGSSHMERS